MISNDFISKSPMDWGSNDIAMFMENVSDIAGDGDIGTRNPRLRELALEYIELKKEREENNSNLGMGA